MEYIIRVEKEIDFSRAEKAEISTYKWTEGYAPKAYGELIFVEEKGFALRMTAFEDTPKAVYTKYDEPVYKDSCLEFFVSFNLDNGKYMNFEMNANGAFLSAVRTDRKNKTEIDKLAPLPEVKPFKGDGFWGVETFFSLDFVEKTAGKSSFARGESFKGNFYKCGDETEIPHFGMWSPVGTENPDFHRPEFFGTLTIEK
jgi:hypothetical protein